ncbi:leucine-rich repeat domain-containing protein [Prevotella falsenii]
MNVKAQVKPYDFTDGKLFYKITGKETKEVYAVSEKPRGGYTVKPTGVLAIPESATHEGISYTVTGIGKQAFYMCDGLTSVTLPNTLKAIGDKSFLGCHGLVSVKIPNLVEKIGNWAFMSCAQLERIDVEESNKKYCSKDGVLFNKDVSILIQCPSAKKGDYNIPESVTKISGQAFYGCVGLTAMRIPHNVAYIGNDAFYGCVKLRTIKCELKEPLTGAAMGTEVFEQVSTGDIGGSCKLYVPVGSKKAYEEAKQWKKFIPNILEDETLGVDVVSNSGISVRSEKGKLLIATNGNAADIHVYNVAGMLVYSCIAAEGTDISLPVPEGLYIIKTGNRQTKVVVR